MSVEKKKGFLSKIFGAKPGCCSIQLEEVEKPDQLESGKKGTITPKGCCSPDAVSETVDTDGGGSH